MEGITDINRGNAPVKQYYAPVSFMDGLAKK